MSDTYNFSDVPEPSVDEFYWNADLCLQATVQLAIAADQRATTLAGMFGGGAVALLAVCAAIWTAENPDLPFFSAAFGLAALLFVAAWWCGRSSMPVDFHISGYEPKLLVKSVSDPVWMKRYATEDMQVRIDKNRDVLEKSAAHVRFGSLIAAISPALAVFIYSVSYWLNHSPS